jgi:hypothetical protein
MHALFNALFVNALINECYDLFVYTKEENVHASIPILIFAAEKGR